MIRPTSLRGFFGRRRGARGVSAVEFALLVPAFSALFVGLVDFGLVWSAQMQVTEAAQAGAEYAAANGFNATEIEAAETSAVAASVSATPAPTEVYGCPSGTAITLVSQFDTCASGDTPGTYVEVGASLTHSLIVSWPWFTNPMTLTASAMVRLK